VPDQTAAQIRVRAEQARSLARELHNMQARAELLQIAEALDAEAAKLEVDVAAARSPTPGV